MRKRIENSQQLRISEPFATIYQLLATSYLLARHKESPPGIYLPGGDSYFVWLEA